MENDKQPIGPIVENASTPLGSPLPGPFIGQSIRLEHLEPNHASSLWQSIKGQDSLWTYMLDGPFPASQDDSKGNGSNDASVEFQHSITSKSLSSDPYFYAIHNHHNSQPKTLGHLAIMRIDKVHKVVEIGHILLGKELQRTRGSTEALFLVFQSVFEQLGARRVEWKCHSLNRPSNEAAKRLGFTFEGTFRQHYIVKGRSRDTNWFSILDKEWFEPKSGVKVVLETWLSSSNFFDEDGKQRESLSQIRQRLSQ